MRNPHFSEPVTDHFDGRRFSNSGRTSDKYLRTILRWKLKGQRTAWPTSRPALPLDRPPERPEALRISFVGHASFLLQVAGVDALFDPVWSDRVSPFRRIGPQRLDPLRPGEHFVV